MPLGEGRATVRRAHPSLPDRLERARPWEKGTPEENGIVRNLLIQHTVSRWCSSDRVHEGCGGVDRWLQTKDQALLDFL